MTATRRSVTTVIGAAALAGAILVGGSASAQAPVGQAVASAGSAPDSPDDQFAAALREGEAEPGSNTLRPGETLKPGEFVLAGNGKYGVAQSENGDLLFGLIKQQKVLFRTHTHGNPGAVTHMNEDGNLVVWDPEAEKALWASNTAGSPDNWLQVRDDGKLVIYGQDGKFHWTRNNLIGKLTPGQKLTSERYVSSTDRQYHLIMQKPGNLVLYNKQREPLWSSHTDPVPGSYAVLQHDGNLVIYTPDGDPVWNTRTTEGAALAVQTDGNLVLYDDEQNPVWDTGTGQS